MDNIHQSVELSVSKKNLNCNSIAKYLVKSGIMASITKNHTIICDMHNCHVENGCRILFGGASKNIIRTAWEDLKLYNDLTCAHIKVPNLFSGCIYDFLPNSRCPGAQSFGNVTLNPQNPSSNK